MSEAARALLIEESLQPVCLGRVVAIVLVRFRHRLRSGTGGNWPMSTEPLGKLRLTLA